MQRKENGVMKYSITNAPFAILTFQMEAGEEIKCQSGAMAWMTSGIEMQTKAGGLGGMFKKAVTGESMFYNNYVANSAGELTLAKKAPGDILAFDVASMPIIAQKGAFLASSPATQMDIYLQKKLSAGFFGGEGFIMQKFSGTGMVFVEIDGAAVEKSLAPGEKLTVDTGYVAAMEATCTMEIQTVKGVANILVGGEGLFNTVVTGPGKVWLQTMPLSNMAGAFAPYIAASK